MFALPVEQPVDLPGRTTQTMRNLVNRPMNPLCTPLSLRGSEQPCAPPIEPPYEQPCGGENKPFNRLRKVDEWPDEQGVAQPSGMPHAIDPPRG